MKNEIELYERLARIEVAQALSFGNAMVAKYYIYWCIDNLRNCINSEHPYSVASSDIRYRTFVIELLKQVRDKMENPEEILGNIITGNYKLRITN